MTRPVTRTARTLAPGWHVAWCGGTPIKGSPWPTKAEADAALDRLLQSAKDAKAPIYGSYRVFKVSATSRTTKGAKP